MNTEITKEENEITKEKIKKFQEKVAEIDPIIVDFGEEVEYLVGEVLYHEKLSDILIELDKYEPKIVFENFEVYFEFGNLSEDDPLYDDLIELSSLINGKIETKHYGYYYCTNCNEYTPIIYEPEERRYYQNTSQPCDACGAVMKRVFKSKREIESLLNDEHFFENY